MARVWRREEVFKGRFAEDAPDLLLEPAPLYSLTHAKTAVEPADWMSGDHRMEGVLAAAGPNVDAASVPGDRATWWTWRRPSSPRSGAPASVSAPGRCSRALVGSDAAAARRRPSAAEARVATGGSGLDDIEAEEVEEHLRGLGYLE